MVSSKRGRVAVNGTVLQVEQFSFITEIEEKADTYETLSLAHFNLNLKETIKSRPSSL